MSYYVSHSSDLLRSAHTMMTGSAVAQRYLQKVRLRPGLLLAQWPQDGYVAAAEEGQSVATLSNAAREIARTGATVESRCGLVVVEAVVKIGPPHPATD